MSAIALHVYERLTEAPDDRAKAKIIAEAFGQLEDQYPSLTDLASQGQVRESELKLLKEIEGVRLEIKEVEGKLRKEIEGVRLEIKEVEGKLRKEIEGVRLEIKETELRLQKEIESVRLEIKTVEGTLQRETENVRLEIKAVEVKLQQTEVRLLRAIHRQTLWVIGSVGSIIGLIRLLDWFLAHLPN